jgi:hypothetical protein
MVRSRNPHKDRFDLRLPKWAFELVDRAVRALEVSETDYYRQAIMEQLVRDGFSVPTAAELEKLKARRKKGK